MRAEEYWWFCRDEDDGEDRNAYLTCSNKLISLFPAVRHEYQLSGEIPAAE